MEENKTVLPPDGEAQEVVLQYVAQPQGVVSYYIQPQPLPRRCTASDCAPTARAKRHKGLRTFLICLSAVFVFAAVGVGYFWSDISAYFSDGNGYDSDDIFVAEGATAAIVDLNRYPAGGSARLIYQTEHGEELGAQELYACVAPSTVVVAAELDDLGGRASIGTGIILSQDGYILTNYHVIDRSKRCYIFLYDDTRYEAQLVGFGAREDVAVLKIDAWGLTPAEFGNSDILRVGDPVYAIGNPLGMELRGTMTDGIVSAIDRDVEVDGQIVSVIQTNAALNFGNSGGPLINCYGQVIGMNTLKMRTGYDDAASVEGLGFALPISSIAYMVNDIVRSGEIHGEVIIGISVLRQSVLLPDGTPGLVINFVEPEGPGEKAGLLAGDVIVSVAGEPVSSTAELLRIRRAYGAGEQLPMRIFRDEGYLDALVLLEERR